MPEGVVWKTLPGALLKPTNTVSTYLFSSYLSVIKFGGNHVKKVMWLIEADLLGTHYGMIQWSHLSFLGEKLFDSFQILLRINTTNI